MVRSAPSLQLSLFDEIRVCRQLDIHQARIPARPPEIICEDRHRASMGTSRYCTHAILRALPPSFPPLLPPPPLAPGTHRRYLPSSCLTHARRAADTCVNNTIAMATRTPAVRTLRSFAVRMAAGTYLSQPLDAPADPASIHSPLRSIRLSSQNRQVRGLRTTLFALVSRLVIGLRRLRRYTLFETVACFYLGAPPYLRSDYLGREIRSRNTRWLRSCPPPVRASAKHIVLLEEHHERKKILGFQVSLVFVDVRFSDTHSNCIIEYSEFYYGLPSDSPSCAPCSRSSPTISSQPLGDASSNMLPCFPPTTFTSAPLLEEKADSVHITPQHRELERTAIYFAHCIHVGALLEEDTDNAHMTIAMHWSSSCWLCSRRRHVHLPLWPSSSLRHYRRPPWSRIPTLPSSA
ncbi:hypothetical protein DFH06DRAFT_1435722 [Mycena polygramma]|nr:hypothetical protein DFH06DRAFT_1435722 [Mycena polygramma]